MGEVESPVAQGIVVGEPVSVQGSLRRPSAALDPPGLSDVEEGWATGRKRGLCERKRGGETRGSRELGALAAGMATKESASPRVSPCFLLQSPLPPLRP